MSKSNSLEWLSDQLSPKLTEQLPGKSENSHQPQQTPGIVWHRCDPTPVQSPRLQAHFQEVANLIGLSERQMRSEPMQQFLAGNLNLERFTPYSACYGGHQFGHWAGQLGDGRAITIAEIVYEQQRSELQLKGAGRTPYSRTADGRAVLRSSIREFLCSEAMHHLGIPTTRALSLVTTGESVVRDMMYDGNVAAEPGAIVCRVAPSFIRFGNFEIFAARDEKDVLNQLIDFTIARDFAELDGTREQKIAKWFAQVCQRTAKMVIDWQRVGFVHGVMNTDNMSILGLTIDYGPYGWLDNFDSGWTPNTTDAQGKRYRFGNQPAICRWNLTCLANALATVIDDIEIFKTGLGLFDLTLSSGMLAMQCDKFGLRNHKDQDQENSAIINKAYQIMQQSNIDFTLFFSTLAKLSIDDPNDKEFENAFYEPIDNAQEFKDWLKAYCDLVSEQAVDTEERLSIMKKTNPEFILRNYLTQQAIEKAEKGDFSEVETLMNLLRQPYNLDDDHQDYAKKRPDWAKHKVGCSMLSCSS